MTIPLSVLMTVYNGGQYLHRSVESVLAQSHSDFEFLVVDDASTDGSLGIIEAYRDPRIRIIQNSSNRGQTVSLNIGLREARSEFIARMDADDIALPQWLEKVYNFIKKNRAYSVVSPQALVIDEHNRIRQYTGAPRSYQEVILKNIVGSSVNHVGSLMRRDDIASVGGYDDKYIVAADYDLWTKLLIGGYRLVNMNEALIAIRIYNESVGMRGISIRDAEGIDIMQKNIRNFTNCSLTKNETGILWKILYDITDSDDEACNADELINKLYDNIKPELGLSDDLIQKVKEKKKRGIFKKRIYVLFQNRKCKSARDALRECIRAKGWFNFFGILYFLSFFSAFTKNIETVYHGALNLLIRAKFGTAIKRLKS